MKSAIPWVLAALLAVGVYFFYSANNEKAEQLAKLEPQTAELEKLRAENEELKKIPAQNEELARLRKENLELLRLRAEVQQLHRQTKDLTTELATTKAQGAQAQQKLESESQELRQQKENAQRDQIAKNAAQQIIDACVNNLRQIDIAKQTWAKDNNKGSDAAPTAADLLPYFPTKVLPTCPGGGTYLINPVGLVPSCSVPGHVLTK